MSELRHGAGADQPPAPRLSRAARRRQLLTAAREVFVTHGYHAAGMDDIAVRAGVSKPVLYQHFPGKLELYLALLDEQVAELILSLRSALAATTDNRKRVEAAVAAYFDFVDRKSEAFRLLFESDLRNDPAVRGRVRAGLADCVSAVAVTITADTGVPEDSAQLIAAGLTGLAEMGARWWLDRRPRTGGPAMNKEAAVALMSALAWRGISGFPRQVVGGSPGAGGSPSA